MKTTDICLPKNRHVARRRNLIPLALLFLTGCAPAGPVCYPVRGQVFFDGKPVAEALVVLHPASGNVEGNQKPMAQTDEQGRFALTTYAPDDGAPSGEYTITVTLRAQQMIGEELVRSGANLLPPRYAEAKTSGLRSEVLEGTNDMPPIRLGSL